MLFGFLLRLTRLGHGVMRIHAQNPYFLRFYKTH